MSTRFTSCHTHCVRMQQHVGAHLNRHRNLCTSHSLLPIPTVNSLVIHWCFRVFSAVEEASPTCIRHVDKNTLKDVGRFLRRVNSSPTLPDFVKVHVVSLNLHFAMGSLRLEMLNAASILLSIRYGTRYRINSAW